MKYKTPCMDCLNRAVGCHGMCKDYQDFRAELDSRRPLNYASVDADDYTRRVRAKIYFRRVTNHLLKYRKDD